MHNFYYSKKGDTLMSSINIIMTNVTIQLKPSITLLYAW